MKKADDGTPKLIFLSLLLFLFRERGGITERMKQSQSSSLVAFFAQRLFAANFCKEDGMIGLISVTNPVPAASSEDRNAKIAKKYADISGY